MREEVLQATLDLLEAEMASERRMPASRGSRFPETTTIHRPCWWKRTLRMIDEISDLLRDIASSTIMPLLDFLKSAPND